MTLHTATMQTVKNTIAVCGILLCVTDVIASQDPPGVRFRASKHGIENALDAVFTSLSEVIVGTRLPNIVDDVGNVDIKLDNMIVSSISMPEFEVSIREGRGFTVAVSDMEVQVTGLYAFDISFGFFSTLKTGDIRIVLRNLELTLGFDFDTTETVSLPFSVTTDCESDADVDLYFEGGWSQGFFLGSNILKPLIDNIVTDEACKAITKGVAEQNNNLALIMLLERGVTLDMSFTQMPTFAGDAYLETHHKGDVWHYQDRIVPTEPPAEIPAFPDHTEHMAYVYVTESMLNAGVEAAFLAGMLEARQEERTRDVLPDDLLTLLDTSCSFLSVCFHDLTAPDSKLVTLIEPSSPPVLQLRPNNTVAVHATVMANVLKEYDGLQAPLVDVSLIIDVVATLESNGTDIKLKLHFDDVQATSKLRMLSLPSVFGIADYFTDSISGVVRAQVRLLEKQILDGVSLPPMPGVNVTALTFVPTSHMDLIVVGADIDIIPVDLLNFALYYIG